MIPDKVAERYMKDVAEHAMMLRDDPYYAHCYGGARIPEPRCEYCNEYNGTYCMRWWNNLDECYLDKDRDSKEPDDVCEEYQWTGEWEDDDR